MKLAAVLAFLVASASAASAFVHPSVHRSLRSSGTANIFVTLKDGTANALNRVQENEFATRGQKIASLVESLEINAQNSQKEIAALLVQEASSALFTKTTSFWMTNQVYFEGATFELVEKLASLPSVAGITEEEVIPVAPFVPADDNNGTVLANEYGVAKIGAPELWAKGFNGQGIVVGHIDTGVVASHVAIKDNFRSTHNWYDPEAKKAVPYDDNGHGTHTMGTIAGAGGIGVAPGVTWITCKGCRNKSCPESDLLECFQFMTCPTDTNGDNKDCSLAPRLVSNSWAGGQGSTRYDAAINVWREAGIVPVFGNGNAGPACGTANSPADNANVIAVGATDISDKLASFSSKGPSVNGLLKPDLSAPGVAVRSAWNTGTTDYKSISGTSMATPHVAGAVALMLSYKPTLTYDEIKSALSSTAARSLVVSGYTCGSTADSTFPNNQYGAGRIDVLAAVNSL